MDHGDPGNARYTGLLAAVVTGGKALFGFFLAYGSSAPMRIVYRFTEPKKKEGQPRK